MASAVESTVEFRQLRTDDPVTAELLAAYNAELGAKDVCREDRADTYAHEYVEPEGSFLVLYEDGQPSGIGGIRRLGDGIAEVKRMYVAPHARGSGNGRRMLEALEAEAGRLGYSTLRLDTAASLHSAIGLYRASGFTEIPDYNGNAAAAYWFEKDLAGAAADEGYGAAAWLVWLALWTTYIMWGSTYLGIRVMVETVPPLLGAGARFLLAGLVILAVLRLHRGPGSVRVTRPQVIASAASGTLLLFGGNGLVTIAEQDVPSGLAALLIGSVPLWVVLLRMFSGERVLRLTLVGVGAGFAGVALLVLPADRPEGAPLWGVLLIVLAALLWAVGSFYSRGWPLPPDAFVSTSMQMILGGAVMLLLGTAAGEIGDFHPGDISGRSFSGFAFLVTGGSLAAFTAYTWLLRNAPISKVATYAYVNPVVAIFLGWLLLSEDVTGTVMVGAGLIVASVALVVTRETGH